MSRFVLSAKLLEETFRHFRDCGGGRRECQVLWTSAWEAPFVITHVVHSQHRGHAGGFDMDSAWLSDFWLDLANQRRGVRVQVHTHPFDAFHSVTDDAFPIVHTPGFLSLVIPKFATGPVSLDDSFLCEITADGGWRAAPSKSRIEVTP